MVLPSALFHFFFSINGPDTGLVATLILNVSETYQERTAIRSSATNFQNIRPAQRSRLVLPGRRRLKKQAIEPTSIPSTYLQKALVDCENALS